jgi:hypothetical protein
MIGGNDCSVEKAKNDFDVLRSIQLDQVVRKNSSKEINGIWSALDHGLRTFLLAS